MRLIRFVAVACMVAVSVASLGCSETAAPEKPAEKPAETSSVETPADTTTPEAATAASTTPVSLAITGMA